MWFLPIATAAVAQDCSRGCYEYVIGPSCGNWEMADGQKCRAMTPEERARKQQDLDRAARERARLDAAKREHEAAVQAEIKKYGEHRAEEARKVVEMREAAERARAKQTFGSCRDVSRRLSEAEALAEQEARRGIKGTACEY